MVPGLKSVLRKFFFPFLLTLPFIFYSCKTTKKIVVAAPIKLRGADVIQVFDSMIAHQFTYEWLILKASVDYKGPGNESESFDINLRARKDSAVWISITPLLGIEAVRVLVTRDSMQILDRVHKTYSAYGYDYLDSLLKTRLNFEIIQAIISGNYFPYLKNEKLKSLYEEDSTTILSSMNKRKLKRAMEDKDPNKPLVQDFWINGNYRITKSRMEDDKLNRSLEVSYSDFTETASGLIPNKILVNVTSSASSTIQVEYSKITIDEPTTLPFSVPEKYERK